MANQHLDRVDLAKRFLTQNHNGWLSPLIKRLMAYNQKSLPQVTFSQLLQKPLCGLTEHGSPSPVTQLQP